MSCQAGMWNFDGRPVDREFLAALGDSIDQYGPDGGGEYLQSFAGGSQYAYWAGDNGAAKQGKQLSMEVRGSFAMIYRAFHTNKESRLERQPYVSKRGNVMTWDGRLDNRNELMRALAYELSTEHSRNFPGGAGSATDVAIVMAAWEAWGTECFKRLIGDFSLAVWEPGTQTLTLAKDFIGVRYLYYEVLPEGVGGNWDRYPYLTPESGAGQPPKGPCVWWCSRLEPLILYSGRQYEINDEYIAGYFAFHPANHITPYVGVHALPAGHYVQIRPPHGSGSQVRLSRGTATGLRAWLHTSLAPKSVIPPALRRADASAGPTERGSKARVGADFSPPLTLSKARALSSNTSQQSLVTNHQYWHFDPDKRITYKSDAEYEEHFRHVFFQSVKRRLRADAPVVTGLSGGRDSSAIVCVADQLIARGEVECPRLDTYSRYAEDEPFQDDKRYLTIVEQKRGRTGYHMSAGSSRMQAASCPQKRLRQLETSCFSAHPGHDQGAAEGTQERLDFMKPNGYRIILTGIGGDEVTGGVPNAISELADLLVQGRVARLATRLQAWAVAQKQPTLHVLLRTIKSARPDFLRRVFWDKKQVWPWIDKDFVTRQCSTFREGPAAGMPLDGLPSFRGRVGGAVGVSWQLANTPKLHRRGAKENCYDRGFPFLDRDFLEFMFAIPREQILEPGRYRSLMRRALIGVVPNEILNRTRKAFAVRRPTLQIGALSAEIGDLFVQPLSGGLGYVNPGQYLESVNELAAGKNNLVVPALQVVALEMWLRSLAQRGILKGAPSVSESRVRVLESVA